MFLAGVHFFIVNFGDVDGTKYPRMDQVKNM